jgi:hypothetical protein
LELYIGGQLYARTTEAPLDVGLPGGRSMLWLWILLGILGGAGLGFLIFFLWRRRKKGEEKPRKAEKKRKEEKPARKAEEPVRRPEPYRPPEPVRPAPPLPEEEPVVEPAPLSSVSTLKARMASLGRDQGTGQPAEEVPDAVKTEAPAEMGSEDSVAVVVPPPPKAEPTRPAGKTAIDRGQKPPVSDKPSTGQKPGIFSKVTATGKKEPPKPAKPDNDIQINWPPKSVEPVKPLADVQINWPPKTMEPAKPTSNLADLARQRTEAQQSAANEAAPAEEAAIEEPTEPSVASSRSSFAEAARLRMEARQRPTQTDEPAAETEEPQPEGKSGEGEERPPSS